MNSHAPFANGLGLYRSAISARLVYLREIIRTAFWEFCNTIGTKRTWREVCVAADEVDAADDFMARNDRIFDASLSCTWRGAPGAASTIA
jgi:hypothetical protein